MKISSFEKTYNSDYNNDIEIINNNITDLFFDKGVTPLNLGRIIQVFRREFSKYFSRKYNKNIKFMVILPRNNHEFIDKKIVDKREIIRIYLSYEKISNLLLGNDDNFLDYLYMLFDQIESELKCVSDNFNNYLVIQMDILVDICYNELSVYSKSFLTNNILKSSSWQKLSKHSCVFNDYYNFYQEDKNSNKKIFNIFLNKLLKRYEIQQQNYF